MKNIDRFVHYFILCVLVWTFMPASPVSALTFCPLDQEEVIQASQAVNAGKYPNAEVVFVDQQTWVHYAQDGTFVQWYESYVKILTEKGRRRYTSVTSSFTIPYNTTMFTVVEVLRSDGTIIKIDIAENSREMVEQSQMESNIYNPNDRLIRVTIPEVHIGDVVHFIMFDEFSKARMPDTFSDYVPMEGTDPIARSVYTIVAPKARPLKSIALKSEIPGTITTEINEAGEEIVYTWVAKDVPRAYTEPRMPKLYTQAQRLLVSTIPDWGTVSRWYWNLSEPHMEKTTPEMKKTVHDLVRGIDDPDKRIEKIFRWVSQEIRYLGITAETEAPGYEPHRVDMTFERRAGVCRDKAALLVSMLRLAGFEAFPVLIMNGPKKDPEVPQPYFNHAISCVRKKDGTYTLMDATDESTKELFPAYLNNQSYLVATPQGETLLTSEVAPPEKNMMHIETKGSLDEQGNLKASSVLQFYGINDNAYRGYFSRLSAEERRQFFERIIKKIAPGSTLAEYEITPGNMLDTTTSLKAGISFEVQDFAIPGKDMVMLPVVRLGGSIGIVNFLTGDMGLVERKYPYVTDVACGVEESFQLDLKGFVGEPASLPEFETAQTTGALWKLDISVKDHVLISNNTFAMKLPEYSPKEYLDLKQTLIKIEADEKRMPVFTLAQGVAGPGEHPWYAPYDPDAVILDELAEFDVKDSSTWTETRHVKMKVLTYAGKKHYSDLYVRYNPSWEEVEIVNAVVTSADGQTKTIEKKEMNTMDAPWAADAPRYPSSKILVVSLPGVEQGSIIEYTIKRNKTGREFFSIHDGFISSDLARIENPRNNSNQVLSIDGVFRYHEPVESKTLRIRAPKDLELIMSGLDAEEKSFIPDTCPGPAQINRRVLSSDGSVVYEFTSSRIAAVTQEDNLPPWYSFNPVIFASSGDWKTYCRDLYRIFIDAASSDDKTGAKALELVAGTDDALEKIRIIRDFAAKNLRFVETGFGEIPPSYIGSADRVLKDGYGNSADRAVVIFAMLRSIGFAPEFILASRIPAVQSIQAPLFRYPSHQWFGEVLVRVESGGSYVYLNDTDQYAHLGTVKNDGHTGLVLKSGKFEIIRSFSKDLETRTDVTVSIGLSQDGDVVMKKSTMFYGQDFASFKKRFSEMPPEERDRYHQKLVSSVSQAARPDGGLTTDYDSYPGLEEFSISAGSYAIRQGSYLYLDLPGLISTLRGVGNDTRKNPLYSPSMKKGTVTIDVVLPERVKGIQLMPPERMNLSPGRMGELDLETRLVYDQEGLSPAGIVVREDIRFDPAVILPEEYPQLLDVQRTLSRPGSRMIVLEME
ncbi:MAG: DUF3857 domain-containing protein, partial [Deltaproteobacteria bacterium]|nr:DUF3857 domain-containing protein [Deltaproteobacteria bacterium]